ncbi:MAG: 3-deoxy-manno-octulosonate cytidylyltransferase [Bacteroidales bacterium]|nr:3-deoxy-manno-octulosonate cytidylyltransferase [Bacteroidales bacterium]
MTVTGIIPARYGSSRFPGKPLAMIHGKSMIRRVYEQASACRTLSRIVVATDHEQIFSQVRDFGGEVMMTSPNHPSGTDRCWEVIEKSGDPCDVVVNIQGDVPFQDPGQIDQMVRMFENPEVLIASMAGKITHRGELENHALVKVVTTSNGVALYFSRHPIPFVRDSEPEQWLQHFTFLKHIGVYGFRRHILEQLVHLPVSNLEKAESLEQLRWLENGFPVHILLTEGDSPSVDTPDDLSKLLNKP